METPEGPIFETNAILRHIARVSGKLYGANNFENSQVDQWLDWINSNLKTLTPKFITQIFGFEGFGLNYEKANLFKAKKAFANQLKIIEAALIGKTTLVGSEITIADIAFVNAMMQYWTFLICDKERKQFPNISNLMAHVAETEAFKKWWGKIRALPKNLDWPFYDQPKDAQPKKKKEKKKN